MGNEPTSHFMSYRKVTGALIAILVSVFSCLAQSDAATPHADEKAEQIVQKAIQAIGGDAYLNVKTVIGRGFYTDYHDGVSGVPLRFVDYIAYPDRERTEFSGDGNRIIQTNYQNEGWMFDAAGEIFERPDRETGRGLSHRHADEHGESFARLVAQRRRDVKLRRQT